MRKSLLTVAAAAAIGFTGAAAHAAAFLNEFHYDNAGTDAGEFIEVVLDGGTDPANVIVSLYNGSDNQLYTDTGTVGADLFNLATHFTAHGTQSDGRDYYSLTLPSNGLQNGAPDGIAVDISGVLSEFWSYEGTMTAVGGPANGATSTDVGVFQDSTTPVGSSLQRVLFSGFWLRTDGSNTQGTINAVPEPAALSLLVVGAMGLIARRRLRRGSNGTGRTCGQQFA